MSNRDLFATVVAPPLTLGSRQWYTVPLAVFLHVLGIGAGVIAPLMATDVLPSPPALLAFVTAPAPPLSPPAPPPVNRIAERPPTTDLRSDAAPVEAPSGIMPEALPSEGAVEDDGLVAGIVPGSVMGLFESPAPPPPPAVPVKVRVGGSIQQLRKIRHVNPAYPQIAQDARVEGVVIIEATIGPDGRVQAAKILKSIALLDQPAFEAVQQWEFTPTLLNSVPVSVVMTVTVNFTLR